MTLSAPSRRRRINSQKWRRKRHRPCLLEPPSSHWPPKAVRQRIQMIVSDTNRRPLMMRTIHRSRPRHSSSVPVEMNARPPQRGRRTLPPPQGHLAFASHVNNITGANAARCLLRLPLQDSRGLPGSTPRPVVIVSIVMQRHRIEFLEWVGNLATGRRQPAVKGYTFDFASRHLPALVLIVHRVSGAVAEIDRVRLFDVSEVDGIDATALIGDNGRLAMPEQGPRGGPEEGMRLHVRCTGARSEAAKFVLVQ